MKVKALQRLLAMPGVDPEADFYVREQIGEDISYKSVKALVLENEQDREDETDVVIEIEG